MTISFVPTTAALAPSSVANPIPVHLISAQALETGIAALGAAAEAWVRATGFTAGAGSDLLVPGPDGRIAAVLFGLGDAGDPARTPFLPGALATRLPTGDYRIVDYGGEDPLLVTLGWALSAYRFTRYRRRHNELPRLVPPNATVAAEVERIAGGVYLARDLINTPANDLGPAEIAATARDIADRFGASFREVAGEELRRDFPLIHVVGAASERPPCLVDLTWGAADAPKVTIIGKGVAFDTGGLDIKPSAGMAIMKKDMGGAANALGLARMVMSAGLPVRLRVLVPAVENAISGRAFRPGDVYRSRKGLTVEIGNTDAEGRLILADAMALADEEAPDLLIDLATLTGAARIALGPDIPPVFTRDENFAKELAEASEATFDPCWRLPLWPGYESTLESRIADVNHISGGPFAGAVTAALFLGRFVKKARTWLHCDIYGWSPAAKPGKTEGGEAQVIRALDRLLVRRYGSG